MVLVSLCCLFSLGEAVNLLDYHSKGPLPLFNKWWSDAVAITGVEESCAKVSRTRKSQLGVESTCDLKAGAVIVSTGARDWLDPYALVRRATTVASNMDQLGGQPFLDFVARSPIEKEVLNELVAVHEGHLVTLKPCGTVLQVVPPSSPSALATVLLRLLLVPSSSSPLQPWLQLLPTVGDSPLQWDASDVELVRGTVLHEEVESFLSTATHSFEILDNHFFQKHRNTFPKSLFTLENFLWAYHLVVSRSYILGEGGYERRVMLPKADMLNHGIIRSASHQQTPESLSVANAGVRVVEATEGEAAKFVVEALTHISPGEEVLINYGQLTNAELLLQYGFLMEGNPLDNHLQTIRQQLLSVQPQDLLSRYESSVGSLEDAEELTVSSTRVCLEWDALLTVGMGDLNGSGAEKKASYLQRMEKSLQKCIGILQRSLEDCSTTVDQDRQLLNSRSLSPHQFLAVSARLEEKEKMLKAAVGLKVKSMFWQNFFKDNPTPQPNNSLKTSPTLSVSPTPIVSTSATKQSAQGTLSVSPSISSSVTATVASPIVAPSATSASEADTQDTDFNTAISNAPQSLQSDVPAHGASKEAQEREAITPESRERLARVERLRAQQNLMNRLRTELSARPEDESVIEETVWRQIPREESDEPVMARYERTNSTTIAILVATICTEDVVSALELPLISILTESFVSTLCKSAMTDNCHRQPKVVGGEFVEQERSFNSGEHKKMSESRREILEASHKTVVDRSKEGREEEPNEEFTFVFYIGFDEGDSFYDSEYNMRQMSAAFSVLSRKYPGVHFHIYRHRETKGKPVWVWNELANMAYYDGCDYLFQVNDDMRFLTTDWAPYLVAQLRQSPIMPNFGVTGPRDIRRNLLTQAFVHRSHLELFQGYMFPKSFVNWYMDDWIQHVYGDLEKGAFSVIPSSLPHAVHRPEVENSPHPPRYPIDYKGYTHISEDLILGCQLIQEYLNVKQYSAWHEWPCTVVVARTVEEGASMFLEPAVISLSARPVFKKTEDRFHSALAKVAEGTRVVLTFTNWGVMDMTRNWLSYAAMWGVRNFLVIALDQRSYTALAEAGVEVFFDPAHSVSAEVQEYLSGDYRQLVNMKTYFMWQTLGRGFDAFLCDNDVVFLRNPFHQQPLEMDVYFQDDTQRKSAADPSVALNSGFVMARSNYRTLDLWEQAYHLTQTVDEYQDQRALNILLSSSHRYRVRLAVLDAALYPNGWNFFISRLPQRTLGGELPVVVHNNWLQGYASKVHRFREELLWTIDPDSYYADPDLRLLVFHMKRYGPEETEAMAMQTLDLATALVLARRLNRTLVLPRLYAYGSLSDDWGLEMTTAETFYDIERLNAFNNVRESSFPKSPVLKHLRDQGTALAVDRGMLLNLVGKDGRKVRPSEMATVIGTGSFVRVASSAVLQMDVTKGPNGKLVVDDLAEFLAPAVADVGTLLLHCGDSSNGHLNEFVSIGQLGKEETQELFHALALRSRGPHRPVDQL